jgi:hydroxyacylglutathione hydrolase
MKSWITKNDQRIYRVLGGRCNCFLVSYSNKHLLVDTGRENRWKNLSKRLDQLRVSHKLLIALILTHSHFDHAENVANVKEKYGTAIIIHKSEADYLQRGENPAIRGTTSLLSCSMEPRLNIHR